MIVAIVSTKQGRWHSDLTDGSSTANTLLQTLKQGEQGFSQGDPSIQYEDSLLLGFALMRSWKLQTGSAQCSCHKELRAKLSRKHKRSSALHFFEHEVITAAMLDEPIRIDEDPYTANSLSLGRALYQRFGRHDSYLSCGGGLLTDAAQKRRPAAEIIDDWCQRYSLSLDVHVWPACSPIARALASGTLRADITALVPRSVSGQWQPCILPARSLRRKLLKSPGSASEYRIHEREARTAKLNKTPKRRPPVPIHDLLNALDVGSDLKDQSKLKDNMTKSLRFFYPKDWKLRKAKLEGSGKRAPSKWTMRRARVRLDVAAMLHHREWSKTRLLFRYISVDASPQLQMSHEVFVGVERIVERSALQNKSKASVSADSIRMRKLPLATLGQGKQALEDKVAAHVHQTWCDYGPSRADVRTACASVRQVLTDMGAEFGIANYPDVIDECIKLQRDEASGGDGVSSHEFLFPYALQVPGLLHLLDWVVRQTIEDLPWWPAWQSKAKKILQYAHGQNHRDLLKKLIGQCAAHSEAEREMSDSLKAQPGRFAKWRWKTLKQAAVDLVRIEQALRFVAAHSDDFSKDLHMRNKTEAAALHMACADPLLWDQASAIAYIVRWPMALMSWIQGCDCHQEELKAGKAVDCIWKGCRAKLLWAAIQQTLGHIQEDRQKLKSGDFGQVDHRGLVRALTKCMASVSMKFNWVNELPYLVWQASDI